MNTVNLMEKSAFNPTLLTMPLASGLNAAAWDYMMNDNPDATFGVSTAKDLFNGAMDKKRKFNLFLNSLIGAGAGFSLGHGFKKVDKLDKLNNVIGKAIDPEKAGKGIAMATGEVALSPLKDLIVNSLPLPTKVDNTLTEVSDNAKAALQETKNNSNTMKWLAGAGIAGALGLGGLGVAKYLASKDKEDKARIKYKLKGKEGDPNTGAVIEMPIDSPEFSDNLMEGLNMGIKRQVGKTIKYNSLKIDPETGRKIPYEEYMRKYGQPDGQEVKQASMEKPAGMLGAILTGAAGGTLGAAAGVSLPGEMNPLMKALIGGGVGVGVGSLAALASRPPENASHWETTQQTDTRNAINNLSFANTGSSAIGFAGDVTAPGSPSDVEEKAEAALDFEEEFDKDAAAGPPPQPKVNGLPGRPIQPSGIPVAALPDEVTKGGMPTDFKNRVNNALAAVQAASDNNNIVKPASCNLRDIFDVEFYPFGVMEKAASALSDVKDIMGRIYNENPSFWPYGLNVEGHNGGVYLIRDKMTKQAAGFVGWQTMYCGGKKVGSYSIGVLPEYRNKGFAKEAVAKIISKKASTVDKVVAYIKEDNYRSKALANSLGVPVVEKF